MKSCPVCSIPMDEVKKSGVLIDVCPSCKGVWLDRGELTRLLENIKTYRDEEYDYDDGPLTATVIITEEMTGNMIKTTISIKKKRGIFDVGGHLRLVRPHGFSRGFL